MKHFDYSLRRTEAVLRAALLVATGFLAQPLQAAEPCVWKEVPDPERDVITCGTVLVVEREAKATIIIEERAEGGPPSMIEVENGAILIEVQSGALPTAIRTPHAIAAVRGTTYIVDAHASETAVFVLEGQVEVSKPNETVSVTLQAGEGIDVSAGASLEVQSWNPTRSSELLSRFGR